MSTNLNKNRKDRAALEENTMMRKEGGWKVYGSAVLFFPDRGIFLPWSKNLHICRHTPLETLTFRFNFAFLATLVAVLAGLVKMDLDR